MVHRFSGLAICLVLSLKDVSHPILTVFVIVQHSLTRRGDVRKVGSGEYLFGPLAGLAVQLGGGPGGHRAFFSLNGHVWDGFGGLGGIWAPLGLFKGSGGA